MSSFLREMFSSIVGDFILNRSQFLEKDQYTVDILEAPLSAEEFLALERDVIFKGIRIPENMRLPSSTKGNFLLFEYKRSDGPHEEVLIHMHEAFRALEAHDPIRLRTYENWSTMEFFISSLYDQKTATQNHNIGRLSETLKHCYRATYTPNLEYS